MKVKTKGVLLLFIIYISFISLGLPDSVFGVAWPTMRLSLGVPLAIGGVLSMVSTVGTAISGFVSGYIMSKLGAGKLVLLSCVLTGFSLLAYSYAISFYWLILLTIPLGFGAGSVDAGLNNYVAANYSSRHMNWLHSFWGVGAFIGPNIMNSLIVSSGSWRMGYKTIGFIQLGIAVILLLTLSLWKKNETVNEDLVEEKHTKAKGVELIKRPGVMLAILAFPFYVGAEMGTGYWLGSYLIEGRGIGQLQAGITVSLFFGSIAIGRFFNGFISEKLGNIKLIRSGIIGMVLGLILLTIPINWLSVPAVIIVGLGCAPIYPSMVHETPKRFGRVNSGEIIGYQVGTSYLSGLFIIPLIGLIGSKIGLWTIPLSILMFTILIGITTERLNKLQLS